MSYSVSQAKAAKFQQIMSGDKTNTNSTPVAKISSSNVEEIDLVRGGLEDSKELISKDLKISSNGSSSEKSSIKDSRMKFNSQNPTASSEIFKNSQGENSEGFSVPKVGASLTSEQKEFFYNGKSSGESNGESINIRKVNLPGGAGEFSMPKPASGTTDGVISKISQGKSTGDFSSPVIGANLTNEQKDIIANGKLNGEPLNVRTVNLPGGDGFKQ